MTHFVRIVGLAVLLFLVPRGAAAVTTFYTDEASFLAALTSTPGSIDLKSAANVALADEVASPPADGALLGSNSLTFDDANTGLGTSFTITMTGSPDISFGTAALGSGFRTGLEPSGDGLEDFEHTFVGGATAFGIFLHEFQFTAAPFEVFSGSTSLGSALVPTTSSGPHVTFIGVVSDTPFDRTFFDHTGSGLDNLAVGTHYLVAVPEPSTALLLGLGLVGVVARRRAL